MNIFIDILEQQLEADRRLKRRLHTRAKQLEKCQGALVLKKNSRDDREEYYHQYYSGGKRYFKFIPKTNSWLVESLCEKRSIELLERISERNVEALEDLLEQYEKIEVEEIENRLPASYRGKTNYSQLLYGNVAEDEWRTEEEKLKLSYSDFRTDELVIKACDGTMVRSKSEALLVSVLETLGVPYVYEPVVFLSGKVKRPDFKCYKRSTGQVIIVEHIGLTSNDDYMDYQDKKIKLYIENGYVPNVNLLLTFEDYNGNIDVPSIMRLLELYLK